MYRGRIKNCWNVLAWNVDRLFHSRSYRQRLNLPHIWYCRSITCQIYVHVLLEYPFIIYYTPNILLSTRVSSKCVIGVVDYLSVHVPLLLSLHLSLSLSFSLSFSLPLSLSLSILLSLYFSLYFQELFVATVPINLTLWVGYGPSKKTRSWLHYYSSLHLFYIFFLIASSTWTRMRSIILGASVIILSLDLASHLHQDTYGAGKKGTKVTQT